MSFTNKTPNYNLPQYVAADKPTYLTDFNGAMSAIDTGMHNNAQAISQANDDIGTVKSDISIIKKNITTMQNWQTNTGPIILDSAKGLAYLGNINRNITLCSNVQSFYEFSNTIQLSEEFSSIYGILTRLTLLVEIRTVSIGALYTQYYYIIIPGQNIALEYLNFTGASIYTGTQPYYSVAENYDIITPIVGAKTSTLNSPKDITLGFISRAIVVSQNAAPVLANGAINDLNVNLTIHVGRVLAFL